MVGYYFKVLRTFSFKGRARRAEYWWFVVFNTMAQFALRLLSIWFGLVLNISDDGEFLVNQDMNRDSIPLLETAYALLTLIQVIALAVRRLHDRTLSGWWLVAGLVAVMCAGAFVRVQPSLAPIAVGVVGIIGLAFFVLTVLPGPQGPNKYGPDPKARPGEAEAEAFS